MPSSDPAAIPSVIRFVKTLQPKTILDLGCGFGKWGFLFREYLEVAKGRYYPKDWEVDITWVDIFPKYIVDQHHVFYDRIRVEDVFAFFEHDRQVYEFIMCGDLIEHLDKGFGCTLLEIMRERGKANCVVTPAKFVAQGAYLGNEHESHKCLWTENEFIDRGYSVRTVEGKIIACYAGEPK